MRSSPVETTITSALALVICILTSCTTGTVTGSSAGYDLFRAAESGDLLRVKTLIADGTDVDSKVKHDATPLMVASENGHLAIVQTLISSGADVNAKSKLGQTSLTQAATFGHLQIVRLLISKGADVNVKRFGISGRSALILASGFDHVAVVKALVDAGAELDARGNDDFTALMMASQEGHLKVVKTLCAGGANVNAKNRQGETSLIYASENGHREIVRVLVSAGADVNVKSNNGVTAMSTASHNNHNDIKQILLAHGAVEKTVEAVGYEKHDRKIASGPGYSSTTNGKKTWQIKIKTGEVVEIKQGMTLQEISAALGFNPILLLPNLDLTGARRSESGGIGGSVWIFEYGRLVDLGFRSPGRSGITSFPRRGIGIYP